MNLQSIHQAIEQYRSIPMVRGVIQDISVERRGPGTVAGIRVATNKRDDTLVLRLRPAKSAVIDETYVLTKERTGDDRGPVGVDTFSDVGDGLVEMLRFAFRNQGFENPRLPRIDVPQETPSTATVA